MLIGLNSRKSAQPAAATNDIYDATTADFEEKILAESQKRPVLIDFWAPWCGPCKQLTPILEQAVAAQKGKVALAKVNIDDNPELAQAFRVQSVPMVVAFFQGQPVTGFAGARPKSEVERLLAQLAGLAGDAPEEADPAALLEIAVAALAAGDIARAGAAYAAILETSPEHPQALAGMIRAALAAGEIAEARQIADTLPDSVAKDPHIASARTAVELAEAAPSTPLHEAERALAAAPADPETLFRHAEACFAAGEKDRAVDSLIAIIRANRAWEDEKARLQLLKYFEAWGHGDAASLAGRRKLSSVLFS
jgi:putative thioredoxin